MENTQESMNETNKSEVEHSALALDHPHSHHNPERRDTRTSEAINGAQLKLFERDFINRWKLVPRLERRQGSPWNEPSELSVTSSPSVIRKRNGQVSCAITRRGELGLQMQS